MKIIQNAIQTPDGTIICSTIPEDVITHQDKNGKLYAVTGGNQRLERPGENDYMELSITDQHSLEYLTNNLVWRTYGNEERKPENLKYRKLTSLESAHLEVISKARSISLRHSWVISEILVKRNYWPLRFKREKQKSLI